MSKHVKTFETYLNDSYLEKSNVVKEVLSNYNLKYQIFDINPVLKIVFPYSGNMYNGRWVDMEYQLIESFLKELLRKDYKFQVTETDDSTTVIVNC